MKKSLSEQLKLSRLEGAVWEEITLRFEKALERERELTKLCLTSLQEIGNVIGGPTTNYMPEYERQELLIRVSKISNIVVTVFNKVHELKKET